jgi:hypothetical protein
MPLRVLFAIDPGATGAVAVFHDGQLRRVFRLPKKPEGLDLERLAMQLRDEMREASGAAFEAVLEQSAPMPEKRGQKRGAASAGAFMRTIGKIEGVLGALRIPTRLVYPITWKSHLKLTGKDKDASRALASSLWPWLDLARKNSADLAEACLIGSWHLARPA